MRLYYWGRYEDKLVEYIGRFKFQGVLELGLRLTDEATSALGELLRKNGYDYVVPVPLHKSRRRKREYNQSEIIARRVSRELDVEFIPDSVFRIRSTKQQAKITNEPQRWLNVKDAFGLYDIRNVNFENKKVLIVDDIVTTGATIYEVSRPIFRQFPKFIDVFSLAYAG
jgi:ComF family protein